MRYVLKLMYRGSNHSGWQIQPNARSIQADLNQALSTLLREDIYVVGAGRTDAGVHAAQMYAHFDFSGELRSNFLQSLNGLLSRDIAVHQVYLPQDPTFHTRFSAISRAYAYTLTFKKNPLLDDFSCWVRLPLDLDAVQAAAAAIMDYDEFGSFCKANAGNETNFCQMFHSYWEIHEDRWVYHVKANRFLRGMVRTIVGTLVQVGKGKISVERFREIIEAQDRRLAGQAAPPEGLSLVE
ncbi:MAG: tRNA pseudouridine(38-40) synthase TruA, partial [Bacteroidota bacterium]